MTISEASNNLESGFETRNDWQDRTLDDGSAASLVSRTLTAVDDCSRRLHSNEGSVFKPLQEFQERGKRKDNVVYFYEKSQKRKLHTV